MFLCNIFECFGTYDWSPLQCECWSAAMFANGFGKDLNNCLRLLSSFTCLINDRFQVAIWLADPILSAHVDINLYVQENTALNCAKLPPLWKRQWSGELSLASIYCFWNDVTTSWLDWLSSSFAAYASTGVIWNSRQFQFSDYSWRSENERTIESDA